MRNHLLVMKFGGTSVGSVEAFANVIRIAQDARKDWERVVVVTSAFAGVTNQLLESAQKAASGDSIFFRRTALDLLERHTHMAEAFLPADFRLEKVKEHIALLVSEFSNLCQAIVVLGEATPRALDAISGLGERLCVRVLAPVLQNAGIPAEAVDATHLIVTDAQFQSAVPDLEATRVKTGQVLEPVFAQGILPVVTGFISATPQGIPTTLGRGGSDFSAAVLGAVLGAGEVWIWTDVDGVMTADPRIVPEARTIPEMTFREVAELAYYGAKVLHPKTIRPVVDLGIGLRVCNTFAPEKRGTYIVREGSGPERGVIKAITAVRALKLVTVEGRGMLGVPGVAARTFKTVAATGVSVPLITQSSSEQSICFALPQEAAARVLAALETEFLQEINRKDIDRVWATDEVVIMTVVGEGMRSVPGVAGKLFSALGAERVNVIAIAQGSSEVSISVVLDAQDTEKATRAVHRLVVMNGG